MSKELNCAPSKDNINGSCYSYQDLRYLANSINKYHNQNIKTNNDYDDLYKNIKYYLKGYANEMDWLNIPDLNINHQIKNNIFRPKGPKKNKKWLSTYDINKVMFQYENKYKDFKFLGAWPSDFMEIEKDFTNMKFINKYNNKKIFGIIFNNDKSYQSGSHWVSLYIDLREKIKIYFFDSVGKPPNILIGAFIKSLLKYFNISNKDNDKCILRYNTIQHQTKNTECGVYSMNFIIRLLNGKKYNDIVKNITKDQDMFKCRAVYFN